MTDFDPKIHYDPDNPIETAFQPLPSKKHKQYRQGRPPKFSNCMDLQSACDLYFLQCDQGREVTRWSVKKGEAVTYTEPIPYTVPGLAQFLGFIDRSGLRKSLQSPDLRRTAKDALARIERQRVESMITGASNTIGSIFDLKNNFSYKDRTETEITGGATAQDLLEALSETDPSMADKVKQALVKRMKSKGKKGQLQAISGKKAS